MIEIVTFQESRIISRHLETGKLFYEPMIFILFIHFF